MINIALLLAFHGSSALPAASFPVLSLKDLCPILCTSYDFSKSINKEIARVVRSASIPKILEADYNFKIAAIKGDSYLIGDLIQPRIPKINADIQATAAMSFAPLSNADKRVVSLNLSSTPLENVITLIAKQTGINIVLLAKPEMRITINVREMVLTDALTHIAAIAGIKLIKVRNTMVMADEATLKSSYPKEYAKAYADEAVNATPEKNEEASHSPAVTTPTPVLEVSRVITTNHLSSDKILLSFKTIFDDKKVTAIALPVAMRPTLELVASANQTGILTGIREGESGSRKLLLSGSSENVAFIEKLIREIDQPRASVEITVTIHDVANEALKDSGFQWTLPGIAINEANNNSINFGTFQRGPLSFGATITGLEKADKAKLLASPNICVLDGDRAFILIGERRSFPIVTGTNSTGNPVFSTQTEQVGIYLQVAADISSDGNITLALKPQVSSIIGFLNVNGGSYPQISTREAQTSMHLLDGETGLLGGLMQDEEIQNMQKVPILGDMPIFKELFRYRKKSKRSSQLIISVTPHLKK
jgi:type II secretory pathway component HofQ